MDGGGDTFSSGGEYALGGAMAQPDAGALVGGDYTLGGGFWGGVAALLHTATPTPMATASTYPAS